MAWAILLLGVAWLVLRLWAKKQDDKRQEARDARMAELMAEREKLLHRDDPPSSLGAVVSGPESKAEPPKERVCLGCRTVNPPDAKTCKECGLEL